MRKIERKTREAHYPTETPGSKLAAEARRRANALTDAQRAEALEGAKALIYGRAESKKVAGTRR
ncbi:MAG: hypothetical protein FJ403_22400 [Verrucomicrobia bacterium]|nr:hypothetical protein [Verrucomicrobiota bacterium]